MSDLVKSTSVDLEYLNNPQSLSTPSSSNIEYTKLPNVALFLNDGKQEPNWVTISSGSDVIFKFYNYVNTEQVDEQGNEIKKRERKELNICTKVRTDDNEEDIIVSSITHIEGRIMAMPTHPDFSIWDSSKDVYNKICTCIGSELKDEQSDTLEPYSIVRSLPSKTLYDYEAVKSKTFDIPNPTLQDYIGSRGQTCKDCIRDGNSKQLIDGKIHTCKLKGEVYLVATHLASSAKIPKLKPISSFVDSDGNPIGKLVKYTNNKGEEEEIRVLTLAILLSPSSIRGKNERDQNGKWYTKIMGSHPASIYFKDQGHTMMSSVPVRIYKENLGNYPVVNINPLEDVENNEEEHLALVKHWRDVSPDLSKLLVHLDREEYLSGFTGDKGNGQDNQIDAKVIEVDSNSPFSDDSEDDNLSSFLSIDNQDEGDDELIL